MTAAVIPFPLCRRTAYIAKQIARASDLNYEDGNRLIKQQLVLQRSTLSRKGIDEVLIERELHAFETLLRSAAAPPFQPRGVR